VDSHARLPATSQLAATARTQPVLLAASDAAPDDRCQVLRELGLEVLKFPAAESTDRAQVDLVALLQELGRRCMTHILVEGGSQLLGAFFDARLIDECHVFIAPRLVGGESAPAPVGGRGVAAMSAAIGLEVTSTQTLGEDIYLRGRIRSASA
jgi:diaminohydroxyphosphoribosylaminopyrimidine deaminase/5-amino-6-(5-phosphoribosylamino)uracil reductase